MNLKAPFPYFGGKSGAAERVWNALGNVENYVEPFFGSGAVLLARPHEPTVETVSDIDGLLSNVWRALHAAPDAVAEHADWPVNEADLFARHTWLVEQREALTERLMGDPEWYDAKAAGWWIWGACAWIGSGWCSGEGGWIVEDGVPVRRKGAGVSRQIPHLRGAGQGIHNPSVSRKIPHLHDGGRGVHRPPSSAHTGYASTTLRDWFARLSARLRNVRVCCGDWSRVVGKSVTYKHLQCYNGGTCGVFLDPPYGDSRKKVYATDDTEVHVAAREWCRAHASIPNMRIVLAGFAGEHDVLEAEGWRVVDIAPRGFLTGGMGNTAGTGKSQMHRDRLWLSPTCLAPTAQVGLPGVE